MRKSILVFVLTLILVLTGHAISNEALGGEADRVGTEVVKDMEISLYMESPKMGMIMPAGMKMVKNPTHHLEVKTHDVKTKAFIPYLTIETTVTNTQTNQSFKAKVPPMIGSSFHYGMNVSLPGKGSYKITLAIQPPDLMRYAQSKDKWATPANLTFDFEHK